MTKFTILGETVEAFQLDRCDNHLSSYFYKWCENNRFYDWDHKLHTCIEFCCDGIKQKAFVGDWIIKDSFSRFYVANDYVFGRCYKEIIEKSISLDNTVHAWVYLSENNGPLPFPIEKADDSREGNHSDYVHAELAHLNDGFTETTNICRDNFTPVGEVIPRFYYETGWRDAEKHHFIAEAENADKKSDAIGLVARKVSLDYYC